jgi:hypothetical protein
MNKIAKKVLIPLAIILAVLAVASQLYSYYTQKAPEDEIVLELATMTPEELATKDLLSADEKAILGLPNVGIYEVTSRDESGKPVEYRFIGMQNPTPIALDLMTDEEKARFGLQNFQVQVLHRDSQGNIMSYHIMKDANDIVTAY